MVTRFLFKCQTIKRLMPSKRRGTTALEMALIAPAFFLLLIGSMEASLMFTAQELLENATFNASRLGATGYINAGQNQLQTITAAVVTELQSYGNMFTIASVEINAASYSSFTAAAAGGVPCGNANTGSFGGSQQIVTYTVCYPWYFFTPMVGKILGTQDSNGNYFVNLTSQIVVQNEP
jgi:Flp pilus assembly protein TadG